MFTQTYTTVCSTFVQEIPRMERTQKSLNRNKLRFIHPIKYNLEPKGASFATPTNMTDCGCHSAKSDRS